MHASTLARALLTVDRDMWFRTTMYVVEGHWGEGTRADLVVTAFHQTKDPIPPMTLTVSSWRRSGDAQLPYRVKASANYVVARQARIEASERGFDDAILLNDAGRVAEATGSCVVAFRDGMVITPPPYEGALESITLDVVERICRRDGLAFERRPLDRTELLTSDEAAVAGTISELTPISRIDAAELRVDGVLASLRDRYLGAMRRVEPLADLDFEVVDVGELDKDGRSASRLARTLRNERYAHGSITSVSPFGALARTPLSVRTRAASLMSRKGSPERSATSSRLC